MKTCIPLQSETLLRDRWQVFSKILACDTTKIIYNSQLFLLPLITIYEQIKSSQAFIDDFNDNFELKIKNIFDPKIAAHLCSADLTDQELELEQLFVDFSISNENSISYSHVGENFGRVTKSLNSNKTPLKNLHILYDKLSSKLTYIGSLDVLKRLEMPIVKLLVEMEVRGVCVSMDHMEEITKTLSKALNLLQKRASQLVKQDFNMASSDQVAVVLYDKLHLPGPVLASNQRHKSTSEEDLMKIKSLHPIVQIILDFRSLSKVANTNVEGLKQFLIKLPSDSQIGLMDNKFKKVHAIWKQCSVRTGRLSCCKPNLQNIPKHEVCVKLDVDNQVSDIKLNIRNMFCASEKCILISADYSQIEMRILAHVANDTEMKKLFTCGGDIYRHLASMILNKSIDDIEPTERERAKTICLGIH